MIRPIRPLFLVLDIVGALLGFLLTFPVSMVMIGSVASVWFSGPAVSVLYVVVAVMMWAAAAIGRLSPALALILAWAAAVLQMACGMWPAPFNLAVLVVLFATAAWGSRTVMWLGGGSAVLGGLVAGAYIALAGVGATEDSTGEAARQMLIFGMLLAVSGILALALAWGGGLLWRVIQQARRTRAAQIRAEEQAAAEQERVRIARDMHDIVAHSLAVVIAQSDGARYAAASDPAQASEALVTIGQTARAALSDVRLLLAQLRHRQGDGPQPTLADLEGLYAQVRGAGVDLRVTVDPVPQGDPPGAVQLAVYRILQEALTNALRHGQGDVDVVLRWREEHVEISVRNGFAGGAAGSGGHGLVGMRERAQLVGGTLTAGPEGTQFAVQAVLPIGEA